MNKYIKITLVCLAVNISSCSEDYLDLVPVSSITAKNFYKTQADFELAINAVHRQWDDLFQTVWTSYTEFRCDNLTADMYFYYEAATNNFGLTSTSNGWNRFYQIIAYSNSILDRIDGIETFNESARSRIKGEARFFRAEAYFALVRFFGAVPLVKNEITSVEALKLGKAPMDEILNFIEEDYKFALANVKQDFNWDNTYGKIHKYGVEGQLARFYITLSGKVYNKNRWADAKPLLEDVLFSSPFGFADTFAEMFDGSNEKGKEIILSAVFSPGSTGINTQYNIQFTLSAMNTNALLSTNLEVGVFEAFEEGDLRKDETVAEGYYNLVGTWLAQPCNVKFDWGFDRVSNTSGMDAYILRYTDLQLLYGELLAEMANNVTSDALLYLNKSRVRAGLPALTTTDVPDIATYRLAMEKERRCELMFECVRWFDLVRTGRAVEVLRAIGKDADETWLLYPIPQTEIDKVGSELLPQNPGYGF